MTAANAGVRLKVTRATYYIYNMSTRSTGPLLLCVRCGDGRNEYSWTAPHGGGIAIQDLPGKGKGVLALRSFERGEVILCERPLVRWFQDVRKKKADNLRYLITTVEALPPASAAAFFDLEQSVVHGAEKTCLGVFQSNAYPSDDVPLHETSLETDIVSSSVYATFCRFNHACAQNVRYQWQHEIGAMVVFANRPIAQGEELTSTYFGMEVDPRRSPHENRRAYLRASFDFECMCNLCLTQSGSSAPHTA